MFIADSHHWAQRRVDPIGPQQRVFCKALGALAQQFRECRPKGAWAFKSRIQLRFDHRAAFGERRKTLAQSPLPRHFQKCHAKLTLKGTPGGGRIHTKGGHILLRKAMGRAGVESAEVPGFGGREVVDGGDVAAVGCAIEGPYRQCYFRLDIGPEQLSVPYTVFPDIISLGNSTYEEDLSWATRVRVYLEDEYPQYTMYSDQTCRTSCSFPSCFSTEALNEIVFTKEGTYVIEVSNSYGTRSGSITLKLSPPAVEVITNVAGLIEGGGELTGTLHSRETTVYSIENILGDINVNFFAFAVRR